MNYYSLPAQNETTEFPQHGDPRAVAYANAINLYQYDPRAAGFGYDITDGIRAAISAAMDGRGPGAVAIPPGDWGLRRLDMPDFTEWEEAHSFNRPFRLLGANPELTRIHALDASEPYLIGHPSAGATTGPRGQNSYQEISGMTLIGIGATGVHNVNQPLVALSNAWKPRLADLHLEGTPAGPAIWNWSHNRGGSQGLIMERISTYKGEWIITPGGLQVYDIDTMRSRGVRYLLHLDGPLDTIGKANDVIIRDSVHAYDYLIGGVDTRGHGVNGFPSTAFPGGGGCDNLSMSGFFASQATRKMESGVLAAATSTTVVTLRTTAGEFVNDSTDVYKDCVLRLKDAATGKWHSRWIDSYVAGTRVVTVSVAFPFAPAVGTEYRVQYSDAEARNDGWSADVEAHALLWQPWAYRARVTNIRCEETRSVIATVEGNSDVTLTFPYEIVNDVSYGMRTDGTPWRPRVWNADRPRGSTTAPADAALQSQVYGNPDDEGAARGPIAHITNDTGSTVENGAVVTVKTTDRKLAGASGAIGSNVPHHVVWNAGVTSWANGELMSIALPGVRAQVRVDLTAVGITAGDYVVGKVGNVGTPIGAGVVTAPELGRAVARAIQTVAATGGIANVWCEILR